MMFHVLDNASPKLVAVELYAFKIAEANEGEFDGHPVVGLLLHDGRSFLASDARRSVIDEINEERAKYNFAPVMNAAQRQAAALHIEKRRRLEELKAKLAEMKGGGS
jgi:hypothetical protein